MPTKLLLLTILFASQYISIISDPEEEPVAKKPPKTWTVMKLYKYLNDTYLHRNNPNYDKNMRYMIFDPENYCKYEELEEGNNALQILSEKYNISTYIFLISYMKDKHKNESEEVYDIYIDKLNYLIYRDHKDYEENTTLTVCFFIKENKMRIRTPPGLKKIYTNSENLNILNRRKRDLAKNNFKDVANGVAKDIYKTYIRKTQDSNTNIIIIFTVIFIIGVTMLVFLLTRTKISPQEKKVTEYLDKLKKSNNAKMFFTESCLLCLEEFKSEKETKSEKEEKKADESENKELLEKEKEKEKDEASVIECGHKFHKNCIADWVKKEQKCPFCRTKFDIKGNENATKITSLNFSIMLKEILRIQANRSLLNMDEISRITRLYYPQTSSSRSRKTSNKKIPSSSNNKGFSS